MTYTTMPFSAKLLRSQRKCRSDGPLSLLAEAGMKALESSPVRMLVRRTILSHASILEQSQLRNLAPHRWEYDPPDPCNPFGSEPVIPQKRRLPVSGSFDDLDFRYPTTPFVAEIHNATVMSPSGLAITADSKLIKDSVASNRSSMARLEKALARGVWHNGYRQTRDFIRFPTQTCDRQISVATALIPMWKNYYHWTLECLPRLLGVETYESRTGNSPTVFVPPDLPSWMSESLDLIGSDIDTKPLQPGMTNVDRFVIPSYPSPSRTECFWLRTRAHEGINITNMEPHTYPSRIYITRKNANVRRIKNDDEVLEVLNKFDIQPYALETLSVAEQVRLFVSADLIVSPHGAGLANLVYAHSPTVVELFGHKEKTTFYRLSKLMGFEYHAMFCDHDRKDIIVNVDRLESRIRSVITGEAMPVLESKVYDK